MGGAAATPDETVIGGFISGAQPTRDEDAPASVAYDAFAPHYDSLTAHHDYDWWLSVLLPLAEAAGMSGTRVLDVACGSGKSLRPLLERGWSGVGLDISRGMLAQARQALGPDVPLLEHDMRALPVLGEFDLVLSLCDAVNYVRDERQLVDTFRGFRRNLAPDGVVVFDVNTLSAFRSLATCALVRQEPDRVLLLEGCPGDEEILPGGLLEMDFVVLERRDELFWSCSRTRQVQRHFPESAVRQALGAAGLVCVEVRGQHMELEDTLDEARDSKAVYVAQAIPDERARR